MNSFNNTIFNILNETMDNPYPWKQTFKTEEYTDDFDDTGEEYTKDILSSPQIIHFQTENGMKYIWYAKQNKYNDTFWEIAFGAVESESNGHYQTDIGITSTGNAFRIFATVIDITNAFIEYDQNYEIQTITISSKGNNRTNLYKKYIIPKIENFKIKEEFKTDDDETEIHLQRTF